MSEPSRSLDGFELGFIGLGNMGRPMVRNLVHAGAHVVIANRSPQMVDELAAEGLTRAANAGAVAGATDIVIICVTDTDALDAVLHGRNGVIASLAPGRLVIDMGTSKVRETRVWAEEVMAKGCDYIDAPVSGGAVGAQAGTLSIMAGASEAALARARPVFEVLGDNITHVGAIGAGQVAKLANQSIVGLTIAAVAEALTLAERAGVDPATVRQALTGGFADSRILDLHGGRMIVQEFDRGAHATVQLKDVEQALELADQVGFEMPSLALNKSLWEKMIAMGYAKLDHSGLVKIYREKD
ncbi:MAG: NAD(P)-dependent oxidoreductase [Alphaproteobacteria bacterium]|nr:NAD(P)-dependent oxidoreductase [Alphaproteobacteria bacterium]